MQADGVVLMTDSGDGTGLSVAEEGPADTGLQELPAQSIDASNIRPVWSEAFIPNGYT